MRSGVCPWHRPSRCRHEDLVVPVGRQLVVAGVDDVVVAGDVVGVEGAERGQERGVRDDDVAPALAGERGAEQGQGRAHAEEDQLQEVVGDVVDASWP